MTRAEIERRWFMRFPCVVCAEGEVEAAGAPEMKRRGNTLIWRDVPCPNCGAVYPRCTLTYTQ